MKKGCAFFLVLFFSISVLTYANNKNSSSQNQNSSKKFSAQNLNVIFISSKIRNAQAIADAADKEAVTVIYDYDQTDIHQVSLTLEEIIEWKGRKIDHLSFFCQGAPGSILLGAKESIDLNAVKRNLYDWKAIGKSLTPDARIDFYGCEIGWGENGYKLVKAISLLTGVSVRASDDASGNIHDADWDLEVKTGFSPKSSVINFSELVKTPIYF